MAVKLYPYYGSVYGHQKPYEYKWGRFAAGSGVPVVQGEICAVSGGVWAPLAADQAMAGTIAIAATNITASHLAGYYPIWVPRPGDLWRFELASATACALGASLYYSTSQVLTTSGTYPIGTVVEHGGLPLQQGNADVGDVIDRGTTITANSHMIVNILQSASFYVTLHT